jgi:mannose-6-phosphate isomerase-like protein (cupin superfamily)
MQVIKSFPVFGEDVDVVVSGDMTGGVLAAIVQTCPPGGGPPPHKHANEDEVFRVIEGDFAILREGQWVPIEKGQTQVAYRGCVHTFRNTGQTVGRIMAIITPAGLERYLEEISPLVIPADLPRLAEISQRYGISFVEAPESALAV